MSQKPALLGGPPFFDHKIPIVRPQLPSINSLSHDITSMLESGMLTKGQQLHAFEQAIAEHLGVKHAIGVSSCTAGLMLVYKSLQLTGEVIVPSFTFMATVSALVWNGLRPVFVDVDRATTNIDSNSIEAAITPHTSAIVAIHNFGNPAACEDLVYIAQKYGLSLVFDAAHSFGALYRGIPVGRDGDAHVFSMSPTKLLITGEGGIVATNNDELAENIRIGREYGISKKYDSKFAGMNARLPEFNAILGLHGLSMLEDASVCRNTIAKAYQEQLGNIPGISFQSIHAGDRSAYKDFSIMLDPNAFGITRDMLVQALTAENIETRTFYNPAVHQQTAYLSYAANCVLPNTEWLAENTVCLPIWSNMSYELVKSICQAIERIWHHAAAIHQLYVGEETRKM